MRDFTAMNALASKFGDGFQILAFPCNQFGHQTQEDNSEILSMLKHVRPGGGFTPAAQVTMFEKVNVNGATAHPLFAWLRSQILLPMDSMASVHEAGMPDPLKMVSARASDGNSTLVLWTPVTRSDIAWNFEASGPAAA